MKKLILIIALILFPVWCLAALEDYANSMKLTIDSSLIDSELTNFPVSVRLSASNFDFSYCNADGDDFRFTSDAEGTNFLDYEPWEVFDASAKSAYTHVRIPTIASDTDTDFYMWYRTTDTAPGASHSWVHDITVSGATLAEHGIISNAKAYFPVVTATSTGGLEIYNLKSGNLLHSYPLTSYKTNSQPVIDSDGYIHLYCCTDGPYLIRVTEADGTVDCATDVGTGSNRCDFESMGVDQTNEHLIILTDSGTKAIRMIADGEDAVHSTVWTHADSACAASASYGSPLVIGDYVYVLDDDGVFWVLNLSDGVAQDSVDLGTAYSNYNNMCYDQDHNYIYVTCDQGELNAVNVTTKTDISVVWTVNTWADFTTANIHHTPGYYNDFIYVAVREDAAEADQYYTKIFQLDYSDGSIEWTNADFYNEGLDAMISAIDNAVVLVSGTDVDDLTTGKLRAIGLSDGVTDDTVTLPAGVTCGQLSTIYGSYCLFAMWDGKVAGLSLGEQSVTNPTEFNYFGHNQYGNLYVGNRWTYIGERYVWDDSYVLVSRMYDGTTSMVYDETINGLHGTKSAADQPEEVTGTIGNAQDYDSGEVITVSDNDVLDITGDMTIEYWIKPNAQAIGRSLVGKGNIFDDFADISEWTDTDAQNSVSSVNPAGQLEFDTNTHTSGNFAQRWTDYGTCPNPLVWTLTVKCDSVGTVADTDCAEIGQGNGTHYFDFLMASDGLFVYDSGNGWTEIGTDLVKTGGSAEWQTFTFEVDLSNASPVVDVYLTDTTHTNQLVGDGVACHLDSATATGRINMTLYGETTDNNMIHFDALTVGGYECYSAGLNSDDKIYFSLGDGTTEDTVTSSNAITDDGSTQYYVNHTVSTNDMKTYVNNSEDGSGTFSGTRQSNASSLILGLYYDGLYDELRLSNDDRSDAWRKATYNSGIYNLVSYESISYIPQIIMW